MDYMRIETALTRLAGGPETDGPFYQTAGAFQAILENEDLSPQEKAVKIAEIIEHGIR